MREFPALSPDGESDESRVKGFLWEEITVAVISGDDNKLKNLCLSQQWIIPLEYFYKLIILACKHNRVETLKFLFSGSIQLSPNDTDANISQHCYAKDDDGNNATYYAIRSSNVELLDTLLSGCTCATVLPEIQEELLSVSFEELKLRNIFLSDEMEILVQSKVINLRFFSKYTNTLPSTGENGEQSSDLTDSGKLLIQQRLQLLIQNITTLTREYHHKRVDSRFLYFAKFIVQNIHILKQLLKCSYISVPWEEMEFNLVCFVSAYSKCREMNIYYLSVVEKSKLLKELDTFSETLRHTELLIDRTNVSKLSTRVRLSRQKVVEGIISKYPAFQDLYNDYYKLRDIYSLDIMQKYIDAAWMADPATRDGQLCIKRTLQVMGELLKDTLDSPNLSAAVSDLLLIPMQKETRKGLQDLRNSLSHINHAQKNTLNIDVSQLYSNIQNDIIKIGSVINDINYSKKLNVLKQINLNEMINTDNMDDFDKIMQFIRNFHYKHDKPIFHKVIMKEHQGIEELIEEIKKEIINKTPAEEKILTEIKEIIDSSNKKQFKMKVKFYKVFKLLEWSFLNNSFLLSKQSATCSLGYFQNLDYFSDDRAEENYLEVMWNFKQLLHDLDKNVSFRSSPEIHFKIMYIIVKIAVLYNSKKDSTEWIDEYKGQVSLTRSADKTNGKTVPEYLLDERIIQHLSELRDTIGTGKLPQTFNNVFPLLRKTGQKRLVIEALMLDTMSLLQERYDCLSNNMLYLDESMPLLGGRCLRNYLAHGNPLVDNILSTDSLSSVLLNAIELKEQSVLLNIHGKIGKQIMTPNVSKLKLKFERGLSIINKQEEMCKALIEGNLEALEMCLKNGADIYSRNIDLSTMLHVAAQGNNTDIIQFLLKKNISMDVRDANGQTPLHVAAACGRDIVISFLVQKNSTFIDQVDNNGKTSLHKAAINGHKETVLTLLSLGANIASEDDNHNSPLHYAIINNYFALVKLIISNTPTDDGKETFGDPFSLHVACECGHVELVKFLLENKADVNAKNYQHTRPLHLAASIGHLQIVEELIRHGAYVNLRELNGNTPLICAVRGNHITVVKQLVKHGAFVDVGNTKNNFTPLRVAIHLENTKMIEILLQNNADVNAKYNKDLTPLLLAVRGGNCEIVKQLLEAGAQMDCHILHNLSVLHIGALLGHHSVVTLLIERGCNINEKTSTQSTPLHSAAEGGDHKTVDILLAAGATFDSKNSEGFTPLLYSSLRGHKAVMKSLILKGAQVNVRGPKNCTPLHMAANEDIVALLLENGAEVNAKCEENCTALHIASGLGKNKIAHALIKANADVDATSVTGNTPLHLAVQGNHKDVVKMLLDNGADVNALNTEPRSILSWAARNNYKDILEMLLAKGADVNGNESESLILAISAGHRFIVEALLKRKDVDVTSIVEGKTLLQKAALLGNWHIGRALIDKGINVNLVCPEDSTPALSIAIINGNKEFVDVLLKNGANVNLASPKHTSPLHLAVAKNRPDIVESLLYFGAEHDTLDEINRTPLEIAIHCAQVGNVNILFQHHNYDINCLSYEKPLLHIAVEVGNLEMIEYLIDKGANPNTDKQGIKVTHIAALQGHMKVMEFFLRIGMNIGDVDDDDKTLLHYAALGGHATMTQFLIDKHLDINAVEICGMQPIHYSAWLGHMEVIHVLLQNGAMYNASNRDGAKPLDFIENADIKELLVSVENLFEAVKGNDISKVGLLVRENLKSIAAKNSDNSTLLHLASREGFQEIADILLKHKANPNVFGMGGYTPIHYAAKYSHLGIVKSLLQNSAIYDISNDNGEKPICLATQESIVSILQLVENCFIKTRNCDVRVVEDIKMQDVSTIKAIFNTRNIENNTLLEVGVISGFPEVGSLCNIIQEKFSQATFKMVDVLVENKNYTQALYILHELINERRDILGMDDHGSLELKSHMAVILWLEKKFSKSLNLLEEIYETRKNTFGPNTKASLYMRRLIATNLLQLKRYEEAWEIFQEVIAGQKKTLEEDHEVLLPTKTNAALCLDALEKYEDALDMNYSVYNILKETKGIYHPNTLIVHTNIATVLGHQGYHEAALGIHKSVYKTNEKLFGINHPSTIESSRDIALDLEKLGKVNEALKAYQEMLVIQKDVFGANHCSTLYTYSNIMNLYINEGRYIQAQKTYEEGLEHSNALYENDHPAISEAVIRFKNAKEFIDSFDVAGGINNYECFQNTCEMDIIVAVRDGDMTAVGSLIRHGSNVNSADPDGRTPLHFAANRRDRDIVELLLNNGADGTAISTKGNTPLHIAANRCCVDIVKILLRNVKRIKPIAFKNSFVNAKTVTGGKSALHVSAEKGSIDIVKCLLEYGAIYNIQDRTNKHTPLQCSRNQAVRSLLELVGEVFNYAKKGDTRKLSEQKQEDLVIILNSRDGQHRTPIQVAEINDHCEAVMFLKGCMKFDHDNN